MKEGFSEEIELFCSYADSFIDCLNMSAFEELTVYKVPTLAKTPTVLRTDYFLKAIERNWKYHAERIEREGRR